MALGFEFENGHGVGYLDHEVTPKAAASLGATDEKLRREMKLIPHVAAAAQQQQRAPPTVGQFSMIASGSILGECLQIGSEASPVITELKEAFRVDEGRVKSFLEEKMRGTIEEMMNQMLDAEADALDRLLHRSTVLNIKGESYRLQEKKRASQSTLTD